LSEVLDEKTTLEYFESDRNLAPKFFVCYVELGSPKYWRYANILQAAKKSNRHGEKFQAYKQNYWRFCYLFACFYSKLHFFF